MRVDPAIPPPRAPPLANVQGPPPRSESLGMGRGGARDGVATLERRQLGSAVISNVAKLTIRNVPIVMCNAMYFAKVATVVAALRV